MAKSAAERQRAHRRRVRLGLTQVKVECNEADLITALIDAALLDLASALNPEAVAIAASRALARWIIQEGPKLSVRV
jgi:hypothetical protein